MEDNKSVIRKVRFTKSSAFHEKENAMMAQLVKD